MKSRTVLIVLVAALLMVVLLATAGSASAAPQHAGPIVHVVRYGENLNMIAARYGVSVAAIVRANNLRNADYVYAGQRLVIPGTSTAPAPAPAMPALPANLPGLCTHVVTRGQNLTSIAVRYGIPTLGLMVLNNISNANFIYAGQRLRVPCPGVMSQLPSIAKAVVPSVVKLPVPIVPKPVPAPALHPATCNPSVSIAWPRQNEHVRGIITIVGTADIPDFQFYKVEYGMGEQPFSFASISDVHRYRVVNSTLETWNTDAYPEGVYILRLTAVDNRGQYPPPCDVRIVIDR